MRSISDSIYFLAWPTELHPECESELRELGRANPKLLSKVIYDLKLLREFGLTLLAEGRVKRLSETIYELRTRQGSNINRVLFGIAEDRIFVLTLSFRKKTQTTPTGLIRQAEERLRER